MSRYNSRRKASNNSEMYENILEDRGVVEIIQYTTPTLKCPSEEEVLGIPTIDYVWSQGDKYWRLASKYYGNPKLWWVIAQFNKKPTESHLNPGDTLKIPTDLGMTLGVLT